MKERIKYLQNIGRQRQLLKIKNSSLDELVQSLGFETDAKKMYEALRNLVRAICEIDFEKGEFTTQNSIYRFEFIDI